MKKLLNTINYIFAIVLIISFAIMLIAVAYTFIDLYKTSSFDMSSKDYVENFFKSFNWCKSIIGSVFVLFSVFYAFQTFKVHYKNQLFNNNVAPREKIINEKLNQIKGENKILHNFIGHNGREIIKKIIYEEENNSINNNARLKHYFDIYVQNEIKKFECSGYFGDNCKGDCSTCENKNAKITYSTNSFEHFQLISFELFCISFEYSDFESDIKTLYDANLPK